MRRAIRICLIGIVVLLAAEVSAHAQSFTIIPNSTVFSINNAGAVTGYCCGHGFIRDAGGTITYFDAPVEPRVPIIPFSINNAGAVTGYYSTAGGTADHGFVRDAGGTITSIDVPGASQTEAQSINDAGAVTGQYRLGGRMGTVHGFIRDARGTITSFDAPGSTYTTPAGINNAGAVTGSYDLSHGFIRDAGGTIITFDVPGSLTTSPTGINDAGTVVGSYYDNGSHGFIRDAGGTITTFDVLGSTHAGAASINNRGAVTGSYLQGVDSHGDISHGFIRDAGGTVTNIDAPGSARTTAVSINDAGAVAGYYYDSNFLIHGFIREPGTPDTSPPIITPKIQGTSGLNGWYKSSVNVSWSLSDPESNIASSSGCDPTTLTDDTAGVTLTCSATNGVGLSTSVSVAVKLDKTPPVISGLPAPGCTIWPPDGKLVSVATVSATDALSGLGSFDVTATSNQPSDQASTVITGSGVEPRTVQLRLQRDRVYTIIATATDFAGNSVTDTRTCTVVNKQGTSASTFTTIDFPGAIETRLISINNRGQIVGMYLDTSNIAHAFLLDNGTFTTMMDVFPRGINDKGQIVGDYLDADRHLHGFLLDNGTFTTIDFPGAGYTESDAINNRGQIVGRYTAPPRTDRNLSYLLDGGTFTTLSVLGYDERIFGINDRGQIVGEQGGGGFLLDNGTLTRLPGYSFTGINNQGQIVGTGAGRHAILLDGGTFTMIDFPGASIAPASTSPSGINDHGQIVGSYILGQYDTEKGVRYHGFLLE